MSVAYVIQTGADVLIALGVTFAIFRHKIFVFFKKNKKNGETERSAIEFKDVDD